VDGEAKEEKDYLLNPRINGKILMRALARFRWVMVRICGRLGTR
jgi:hypothetical protein